MRTQEFTPKITPNDAVKHGFPLKISRHGRAAVAGLLSLLASLGHAQAQVTTIFNQGFENGLPAGWSVTGGAWQVGAPAYGPGAAHSGTGCAGIDLSVGTAAANLSTQLVTPYINFLPPANQHPRLRFWQWYQFGASYAGNPDQGEVQILVNGSSTWQTLATFGGNSGGVWSTPSIDLSAYGGQTVQIAFFFQSGNEGNGTGAGWYIDDVQIVAGPEPVLPTLEDFEGTNFTNIWNTWSVFGGSWQVGKPVGGPGAAYSGTNCAGTDLSVGTATANLSTYFVSPPFVVPPTSANPNLNPVLRFEQWYQFGASYAGNPDEGEVQILPSGSNTWQTLATFSGNSGGVWTPASAPLSAYAGQTVQIGFFFQSGNEGNGSGPGWYVDNIEVSPTTSATTTAAPEIIVKTPHGAVFNSDADTVNYGKYMLGSGTSYTFGIVNTGNAALTLGAITIDGTNGASSPDFAETVAPATSVAELGGTTAFTIYVAPSALGARTGTMKIRSTDPVIPGFLIDLLVTGEPVVTYTVTPSARPHGSISPNTAQSVNSGRSIMLTATPDSGFIVNQWAVNGGTQQRGGTTFTFTVTGNSTVEVSFKRPSTGSQ